MRKSLPFVITIGQLEINLMSNETKLGGEKVNLTRTEQRLIEYLGQTTKRGLVLSKDQMVDHLYSHRVDGGPDSAHKCVEVFIIRIKKKLQKMSTKGASYIRFIKWGGYKIIDPEEGK